MNYQFQDGNANSNGCRMKNCSWEVVCLDQVLIDHRIVFKGVERGSF